MSMQDSTFEEEEELCLSLSKVQVNMDNNSKQTDTSTSSSSNVSTAKSSINSETCSYAKNETKFDNSHLVPSPLYSQDLWRGLSASTPGQNFSSNSGQVLNAYAGYQSYETDWSEIYSNNSMYLNSGLLNETEDQSYSMMGSRHVAQMATTQSGLQYLLHNMSTSTDPFFTSLVFEGVFDFLFDVMKDLHGHQLFGKLIQSCSDRNLRLIVTKVTFNVKLMTNLSATKYGSKSMQMLIKVLEESPLIDIVITALSSGFKELMTDRTGSYVILKCLTVLDTEKNKKLYEASVQLCVILAQDVKGCIYLNEFITNSKAPYREILMGEISSKAKFLSQDPSGNFVVQHVLGLHNPLFNEHICLELRDLYIQLSLQQGGSHVVEKCLNSNGMVHVVSVLVKYDKLYQVARDQYGNYVIQAALKATKRAADIRLHQMLLSKLLQHRNQLVYGFGKNVLNLIERGVPMY